VDRFTPTNATLYVTVPGTYNFKAVTSYTLASSVGKGGTPPPVHAPTTEIGQVIVQPPDAVSKASGMGVPTPTGTMITVSDYVYTPTGTPGQYTGGGFYENIPFYINASGVKVPWMAADEWGPDGLASGWRIVNGKILDTMGASLDQIPSNWSTLSNGTVFISYTQKIKFEWGMTVVDATAPGGLRQATYDVSLGSLSWKYIKVNANEWEVQ
jgi:hypothetical protein